MRYKRAMREMSSGLRDMARSGVDNVEPNGNKAVCGLNRRAR